MKVIWSEISDICIRHFYSTCYSIRGSGTLHTLLCRSFKNKHKTHSPCNMKTFSFFYKGGCVHTVCSPPSPVWRTKTYKRKMLHIAETCLKQQEWVNVHSETARRVCYLNSWTDWSALGCFSPWIWSNLVGDFFLFFCFNLTSNQAVIIWPGSHPFLSSGCKSDSKREVQ